VKLRRDEILFRIDDIGDKFYIILQGRIGVLKPIKKQKLSTYKNYYNFLLNLIEIKEPYLFKLNLKANSDIFFSSLEEFNKYKKIIKKLKLVQILYDPKTETHNLIDRLKENIDLDNNPFKLTESKLRNMLLQDEKNFLFDTRKLLEALPEEIELFTKYHSLIDFCTELKYFNFYEYNHFIELRTREFFGDFALDSGDKKRTATIIANEDTVLGCISSDTYMKYIQAEKVKYRNKDIVLLNNFFIFKEIKHIHFEKNYFSDFAPFEYEKDQIIFKQGDQIDKLHIIKSGAIDLFFTANLIEINNLIKNLILKAKEMKIFSRNKAQEMLDSLYDGLNISNKSASYFESLVKKKTYLLYSCLKGESPGIESLMLNIPFLYKAVIKSDRCKIFKLDSEKLNFILYSYQECKKEYFNVVQKKIEEILNRLFNIKRCFVNRNSQEYEIMTMNEKKKLDDQLKKIEEAANKDHEDLPTENTIKINLDEMKTTLKNFRKGTCINQMTEEAFFSSNNLNKSTAIELIANIKPYKNIISKKKPSVEKIKINFQDILDKRLSLETNLLDFNNQTKYGNSQSTKDVFFRKIDNTGVFGRNFLQDPDNKIIDTVVKIGHRSRKNSSNEKDSKKRFDEYLTDKKTEKIGNDKNRKDSINKNNDNNELAKPASGNSNKHIRRRSERKMSLLEFPINKFNSTTKEKMTIIIQEKNNNNSNESFNKNNKQFEELRLEDLKNYNEVAMKNSLVLPKEDKKLLINTKSLLDNINQEKSKVRFDTNKQSYKFNDDSTNLFKENENIYGFKNPSKKFFVAIKDLENPDEEKYNSFLYNQKYFKNMLKFKVKNDVNYLINSKKGSEMFKTNRNFFMSMTQKKLFSSNSYTNYNLDKLNNNTNSNATKHSIFSKNIINNEINKDPDNRKVDSSEIPNLTNYSNNIKSKIDNNAIFLGNSDKKIKLNFDLNQIISDKNSVYNLLSSKIATTNISKKNYSDEAYNKVENDFPSSAKKFTKLTHLMSSPDKNHNNFTTNKNKLNQHNCFEKQVFNRANKIPTINKYYSQNKFFNKNKQLTQGKSVTNKNKNSFSNSQERIINDNSDINKLNKIKIESEKEFFRDSNYFDKFSCIYSTSNGFSSSDKNFRTSMESNIFKKNFNYMGILFFCHKIMKYSYLVLL